MDLSTLSSPVSAAAPGPMSGGDFGVFDAASGAFRDVTAAVHSFGRSTQGLDAVLRTGAQVARQATSGGGSTVSQIGGVAKLFGSGMTALTGVNFATPIGMGLSVFSLVSSLFGGKTSVGPGGGAQFGLDASGKSVFGITNADNGYDPEVNRAAADAVGAAALKFFSQVGGTFKGTAVDGWGGYLGFDAGSKKYGGGDAQGSAKSFDSAEEASQAALIGVIKNAKIEGLSKDIEDRIRSVESAQDLEGLLSYIGELRQIYDMFTGWTAPLTAVEAQLQDLNESFALAAAAAETLSKPLEAVTASYEAQKAYLTQEFIAPLLQRQRQAGGDQIGAALANQEREYALLRKSAAALGGEAVLQVEKTIAAERAKTQRDTATAFAVGALEALQQRFGDLQAELRRAQREQIAGLTQTRDAWAQILRGLQQFRDTLLVGSLSPLGPSEQVAAAQQQFANAAAKAKDGDLEAAGQLQSLAQQALAQTQSYYASGVEYADYFRQVQEVLSSVQGTAQGQVDRAGQQLAALIATQQATRDTATIAREIAVLLQQMSGARANVVAQAAGGNDTAGKAISDAFQQYLGYAPSAAQAKASGDFFASGHTIEETVATIRNVPEAQVRAAYQNALGRDPEGWVSQYWQSVINGGGNLDSLNAALLESEEYKAKHPGFAAGGDHAGGWRVVGEHGPELEATGPARIWSFDETQRLLSNDNSALAAAMATLAVKLDALIRVSAAAGDENAQGLAGLREELAELRRRARLTEAA